MCDKHETMLWSVGTRAAPETGDFYVYRAKLPDVLRRRGEHRARIVRVFVAPSAVDAGYFLSDIVHTAVTIIGSRTGKVYAQVPVNVKGWYVGDTTLTSALEDPAGTFTYTSGKTFLSSEGTHIFYFEPGDLDVEICDADIEPRGADSKEGVLLRITGLGGDESDVLPHIIAPTISVLWSVPEP